MLRTSVLFILLLVLFVPSVSYANTLSLRTSGFEEGYIKDPYMEILDETVKEEEAFTLTLKNADVKQVLRMLAKKARLSIGFKSSIQDSITLDLKSDSAIEMIEQVAQISNLELKMNKDTLIVSQIEKEPIVEPLEYEEPAGEEKVEEPLVEANAVPEFKPVQTQKVVTVKVNYANAYEVSEFINANLVVSEDGVQSIAVAQGQNEIVLVGVDEVLQKAQEIILKMDVRPSVMMFRLNYTHPEKMAKILGATIFNGKCDIVADGDFKQRLNPYSISYDTKQNSLTVVGATNAQIELINNYIKNVDVRKPQAVLDILMVELNEKGSRQFKELSKLKLNNKDGAQYGISHNNKALMELVTCIVADSGGRILARPKVTVANSSSYEINLTSDYVGSKRDKHTYNILKDCGVNLKLCSFINPKKEVVLNLQPSYKSVKQFIPNEKRAKATLLNNKLLKLQNVRLNNFETLVLGGMVSQREFRKGFFSRAKTDNVEFMMFVNVQLLK